MAKKMTQEDILAGDAYTKFVETARKVRYAAKNFGLRPDKAYSLTITAMLGAAMKEILEVRHAQGQDLTVTRPSQEVDIMEDLAHDVGAFLTHMLEAKDPQSRYAVEFIRKGP